MSNAILKKALSVVNAYIMQNYSESELEIIIKEINALLNEQYDFANDYENIYSYREVQEILSSVNEKETIRKAKGVYYTPSDIVKFILFNGVKMVCGKLKPNNLHVLDLNGIPYTSFCYNKTIYDPTCGSGVFLLAALETKLDLLDLHSAKVPKGEIKKVVSTIKGNDINPDSILITKIRLLLCILRRYGVSKIKGLAKTMEPCFTSDDFVSSVPNLNEQFDMIIGNPPYVEDTKSKANPIVKYGNIYANVLDNSAKLLKKDGVMGFVIPLSYVSTPRMKRIRNELSKQIAEQYILSYSDRPDCLFTSVHQKLCIFLGRNANSPQAIYTGGYRYWYREERDDLFNTSESIKNMFVQEDFIPKLGTKIDVDVYRKIIKNKKRFS